MSRIKTTLDALKAQKRKALIPYVMAGFPNAEITPALMHGMVEAGSDIIETNTFSGTTLAQSEFFVEDPRETGKGQVIDCAMSDGAASLMAMFYGFKGAGIWKDERRSNLLDGGAHFYDTYQCRDGKWLSVGAIEPQFYALLLEKTGITDPEFQQQWDRSRWPGLREKLAQVIAQRTRDEWCAIFDGTDACVAPVLDMDEAPLHPHNRSRHTFTEVAGVVQPAAAPRFSRTPPARPTPPRTASDPQALLDWGFGEGELAALRDQGLL